jgi:UDP-N-acetylglucosamine 4,6-dehydratase
MLCGALEVKLHLVCFACGKRRTQTGSLSGQDMVGGEIYVKKTPSMKVTDIARAVDPEVKHIIGIRPGEKLHEQMIGPEDSRHTYEYDAYYKIVPAINDGGNESRIKGGRKVCEGFVYTSDTNTEWMSVEVLRAWIEANRTAVGRI